MSAELAAALKAFGDLRIGVIGDVMLDGYIDGHATRLTPEAPVPVVDVHQRWESPGGAANVAMNLAALGAQVHLFSVTGADDTAERLTALLECGGVDTSGVIRQEGRATLSKVRVTAAGQMLTRIDSGSTCPMEPGAEAAVIEALSASAPALDALLVSDYGYGVMTRAIINALWHQRANHERLLAVDAKDCSRYRRLGVAIAKPNYRQALELLPQEQPVTGEARLHQIAAAASQLLHRTGARALAVTFDADGALVIEPDVPPYRTYSRSAGGSCSGGGDTFFAAFALGLAAGAGTPTAADLAALAASVVVCRPGTSTCSRSDIEAALFTPGKIVSDGAIAASHIAEHRRHGRRIVFTNGCFDLLHRGHITYLNRARALGDLLVVGVNADSSVRQLKGPGRPLTTLDDRMQVLAAMSAVDYVVPFDEPTPIELIRRLCPDVFVKGGDYTVEDLPEAPVVEQLGGEVRILPYVEGRSTTSLVERIRTEQPLGSTGGHR